VRSNDIGLGTPFNLAEGAALLHLVGRLTGYKPRWFSYFVGDAHIYENHIEMVKEQLTREPFRCRNCSSPTACRLRQDRRVRTAMAGTGRALRLLAGELPAPRPLTAPMAV
jgi:hypothetical protein